MSNRRWGMKGIVTNTTPAHDGFDWDELREMFPKGELVFELMDEVERLREACGQMLYHASLAPEDRGDSWLEDCERMRRALEEKP